MTNFIDTTPTTLTDATIRAIGASLGRRLANHAIDLHARGDITDAELRTWRGLDPEDGDELAAAGIRSDADDDGAAFDMVRIRGKS